MINNQNDSGAANAAETVGVIAARDYRKAEVFKKMGIDFCCGGNKTLEEASREAGISEQQLKTALAETDREAFVPSQDVNTWELDFLVDFIINTHHRYIKHNAEVVNGLAQKVAQHHGGNHPELPELAVQVNRFLKEMLAHLVKEEGLLFPYIKRLAASARGEKIALNMPAGFIGNAVNMMQAEHALSGDDLKLFRKITGDYTLPADACNSYNYLFEKLKEFEEDLLMHIHLENNILFPKAVGIEAGLKEESDVY
jgi:regulator of cell morphogenesis and NO signaling